MTIFSMEGAPPDLSEPAELIRQKTLAMIKSDATFCLREEWADKLRARLGGN